MAEVHLWDQLERNKILGFGLLRQNPIHKYIVDFHCPKLKLVNESTMKNMKGMKRKFKER